MRKRRKLRNRLLVLGMLALTGPAVLGTTDATANRQCGPLDVLRGCEIVTTHQVTQRSVDLGGRLLELTTGRGSLWALTCERKCTAQHRPSVGRVVRIDPHSGRVISAMTLRGAAGLAVGRPGVFVIDFWRDNVRRLDPATLRVAAKLGLVLPFELVPGDDEFLPYDVAVTKKAIWVSTARGVVARLDPSGSRVVATVRLPFDAGGEIATDDGALWIAESLAGVYRVDSEANRVEAGLRIGPPRQRLSINEVLVGGGKVFAVGVRTRRDVALGENALARIDPGSNRVEAVTALPAGPLALAYGNGSLWAARFGGTSVDRIDPSTGKVRDRISARVGTALIVAGGRLWTASRDGTVRQIRTPNGVC